MTVTLLPGIYPQISGEYTRINPKVWSIKTFKKHGHKLLQLKVFEITLRSEGNSEKYSEIIDNSPMAKLSYAMVRGNRRQTNQTKANATWDMGLVDTTEIEKACRAEIDLFNPDKKRAGKDVQLVIETMLTIKNDIKCGWHNIYKEGTGEVMVLTYVNRRHIGRMSRADQIACLDLAWEETSCTMDKIAIKKKEFRTVCGDSNVTIKQLKGNRR